MLASLKGSGASTGWKPKPLESISQMLVALMNCQASEGYSLNKSLVVVNFPLSPWLVIRAPHMDKTRL